MTTPCATLLAILGLVLFAATTVAQTASGTTGQPQRSLSETLALYPDGTYRWNPTEAQKPKDDPRAVLLKIERFWSSSPRQKYVGFSQSLRNHIGQGFSARGFQDLVESLKRQKKPSQAGRLASIGRIESVESPYPERLPMQFIDIRVFVVPSLTEQMRERRFLMNAFYLPETYRSAINCTSEPGPWRGSTIYRFAPDYLENHPYDQLVSGPTCFEPGLPAKSYAIVTKDNEGRISSVVRCRKGEFPRKDDVRYNTCRAYFRWRDIWDLRIVVHETQVNRMPAFMEVGRLLFDKFEELAQPRHSSF